MTDQGHMNFTRTVLRDFKIVVLFTVALTMLFAVLMLVVAN